MKKKIASLDPLAEQRIAASRLPQSFKDTFNSLYEASVRTNSADSSATMKWHEDSVNKETYVPILTIRMVKKGILDAEAKKAKAEMKRNPLKKFVATIKGKKP